MNQELQDIIDRQPGMERRRVRTKLEQLVQHWVGIAMFVAWLVGQLAQGTDWLHTRETNEKSAREQIDALRLELAQVPVTYVRRDVFGEVLNNINQRLTSIDNKLAADRR